jgi:hypothetical protein
MLSGTPLDTSYHLLEGKVLDHRFSQATAHRLRERKVLS